MMSKNITVSIHQPNFFPWMGYFQKIARSEVFIFLDNVQYEKKGGTWGNRVKLLINGQSNWITAPIHRNYSGTKKILDVSFNNNYPWRKKFFKSIIFNYKNHLFYKKYIDLVETIIFYECDNLCEYNINAVNKLSDILFLEKNFTRSSNFNIEKKSTELLIELVKKVEGNIYLSGGGDNDYLNKRLFQNENIIVQKQNFKPTPYIQKNSENFISGLSILDCIFNIGASKARSLILDK